MKIGYTPGTGWPASLPGTTLIPRWHLYDGRVQRPEDYEGLDAVILTNASGSVDPDVPVNKIFWISDHINLTSRSPLWGADFLDCHQIYEQQRNGWGVVYAQVKGPNFETPAEARMLATLGAQVVGMSTAIEALAAKRAGCRVYALTFVANRAGAPSNHQDVLAAAAKATPEMVRRLERLMEEIQ